MEDMRKPPKMAVLVGDRVPKGRMCWYCLGCCLSKAPCGELSHIFPIKEPIWKDSYWGWGSKTAGLRAIAEVWEEFMGSKRTWFWYHFFQ